MYKLNIEIIWEEYNMEDMQDFINKSNNNCIHKEEE